MAFIEVNGRTLQYYSTGTGSQTILLIPGGPGLTLDYLNVIHELLPIDQFSVVSYNPSGTFGNINAPFYKSVVSYGHELMGVINALDIKSCFLLGHSWGGAIAQEFIHQYPSYPISGIILANTFISGIQLRDAIVNRSKDLPANFHLQREQALQNGDGDLLDTLIGEYWFPKHVCRTQPLPDQLIASLTPLSDTSMYYYYLGCDLFNISGAILAWDRSKNLRNIKCPILFMSGQFDYLTEEQHHGMVDQCVKASCWFGQHSGHLPMLDEQKEFSQALQKFLSINQDL